MKELISVTLILALCLCLLPVGVTAATEEEKTPVLSLYVGSVNALETPQGDGWSFDAENGVLTLNNCTLTESFVHTIEYVYGDYTEYDLVDTMIYFEGDLTIKLVGNNSVERVINDAPTDYTQYFAIYAGLYQEMVDGENWDMPSKLTIEGSGNLTSGIVISRDCLDEDGNTAWEYLVFSCGIFCNDDGGVDLTGLKDGAWLDIYGGVRDYDAYWNVKAWNTSPTFGSNAVVTAYRDVDGTVENQNGYNANNNDAWRMKVTTANAFLNKKGLLSLLDSGADSGDGWTWANNVLTLSSGTAVKAVEFRQGLGSAKLVLAGNVTLDSTDMGYDANWNSIPCIGTNCDLEIDAGAYTLTFIGDNNSISSYCADVVISGGTLENCSEYGGEISIGGGSLTIQDAVFRSPSSISVSEGYDADWNSVPGGDILIKNASVTLENSINSYGNTVTVQNSDLTITRAYSSINVPNGIFLQDSNITLTASGTALDTNEIVSIDNCNLNITANNEVISCGYVSSNSEEADMSKLSLTNMNITEPAGYQVIAIANNWGSQNVKLANSDGTIATTLIATATKETEEECSHSYGQWVVVTPPTLTSVGEQQKTCSLCGNVVSEEIPCLAGDVESWNLTLADDLSVNFKIALSEEIYDTAQILITVCGYTKTFDAKDLSVNADDNSLMVSSVVSAAQMGEHITVQIVNGEDVSVTKTYSVLQYAQTILAEESMSSYHSLVKEMLNYGAMAQVYFDYDVENLVNDGITGVAATDVPEMSEDMTVSDNISSLNFYGSTLVFRDRIAVRYYFTGDVTGCTFTVNGNTYTPVSKDGMYYVEIADILPQDLDQQITLTVTDAGGNELFVTYGPMNYIVRMNNKGSDSLKNLVKALYNYYLAAKAMA